MEYLKINVLYAGDLNDSHRIPAWLRLEGTSADCLGQAPCLSRVSQSRLIRTVSSQVLSITMAGDFTTSLSNLFCSSTTLTVKRYFSLYSLLLVVSLGNTEKSLAPSSLFPHQGFIHIDTIPLKFSLLQTTAPALSALLCTSDALIL